MILRTLVAACCVTLTGSAVAHAEDSTTTSVPVSVEDTTTTTTLVERPIPERSGTGRRAVYSIRQQHVWVVDGGEMVIRTFPVSGMKGQPKPGTYSVFSQSLSSFSPELPGVTFRYMTRFAIGRNGGNIGFHEIPVRNGKPMQTVEELGTFKGSGCLRSSTADARFMYSWAKPGTKVVVVP
jgi:lipoprotein-anchoring transpeptidase ErfK/SrfK